MRWPWGEDTRSSSLNLATAVWSSSFDSPAGTMPPLSAGKLLPIPQVVSRVSWRSMLDHAVMEVTSNDAGNQWTFAEYRSIFAWKAGGNGRSSWNFPQDL